MYINGKIYKIHQAFPHSSLHTALLKGQAYSSTDENLWGKQKQCPLVVPSCMDGTEAYYITPCFPLAIVLESGNHFISLSCNFLTCEGNRLV